MPYFQHNIFTNEARPDRTSFWHWSKENDKTQVPQLVLKFTPEFVIVCRKVDKEVASYDQFMKMNGYSLVHESIGEMYFKDKVQQLDSYRIYERNILTAAAPAPQR